MPTSPIPLDEFDATERPLRQATTLPPECYSSDAFYEFEKEAIWYREWVCVGRAEQIPEAGDYLRVDIAGEPVVVVRGTDGEIRALSAVCRHRAAIVVSDERGNCGRNIRCPYHWWTYGLDGQLMGAPAMHETEGFDRHDVALPSFPLEVWNGFVFVNLDADATPLAPRLHKFDDVMGNYHASEMLTSRQFGYDADWNWKIMIENGTEHYHAVYLHSKYLPMSASDAIIPDLDPVTESSIISIVPLPVPDLGVSPHLGSFWPPVPTLTEDERKRFVFAAVAPNLFLGLQADLIFWFLLFPSGPSKTRIEWAYCVPKDVREAPSFETVLELVHRGVEAFNDEDFPINTGMQQGLGSKFVARGRYSFEEKPAWQMAQWVVQRYRAEDARARAGASVVGAGGER